MLICLYAYTLQNTYLKLWSLFSWGGGYSTPIPFLCKSFLRSAICDEWPYPDHQHCTKSSWMFNQHLVGWTSVGLVGWYTKSKILNMIMPCCINEYLPFFLITRVFVFLCHCIVWCKHRSQKFTLWRRVNSL